jgi:hypothetical protein
VVVDVSARFALGPKKSLSVNVFENLPAGSCWTITCLEILPMEFLQIFDIEAGAVLAEMRSAT